MLYKSSMNVGFLPHSLQTSLLDSSSQIVVDHGATEILEGENTDNEDSRSPETFPVTVLLSP